MELKTLQEHIRTLATLEETESPVISFYASLHGSDTASKDFMRERLSAVRSSVAKQAKRDFEGAFEKILGFLSRVSSNGPLSVAMFSRAGENPFFLSLEFNVPLPNWFVVGPSPNVYHLVELKDSYHRYVVVLSSTTSARILEINLGEVTKEIWTLRPELRARVGRTWTKRHYQHHREKQSEEFIREMIRIVDKLMSGGGYNHLILAGQPQMATKLSEALPKHLAAKLVDTLNTHPSDSYPEVVASTITAFLEQEERESVAMVDRLVKEIETDGLAVVGTAATLTALETGVADVLILAKDYDPELEIKDTLVKQAELHGCTIEVVNESEVLRNLGGVGCLLRYRVPAGGVDGNL